MRVPMSELRNRETIAIAADHGGFELKATLVDFLRERGIDSWCRK